MQNIFLIGLSGSGKSSVGSMLADRLGRPFIDLDARIEQAFGERIPTLFAKYGEAFFRDYESRVFAENVHANTNAVIATGGGIVTRPENRVALRERGLCIYLIAEPATALERLQAQQAALMAQGLDPEIRPLLAGADALAALRNLYAVRRKWYEEAIISVSTQDKSVEQVVRKIIASLIASGRIAPDDGPKRVTQPVRIGDGYDIIIDWGGLGRLGQELKQLRFHIPSRIFLFTDQHVGALYGDELIKTFKAAGFEPELYTIPAGEASKSQQQVQAIYDWLIERHAERREALIALGGGVVGDLVGFVAATYLRGVPLIQVPTSLLAQVDAAIGGKTGINHPKGKNLIGAFYHPHLVLVDPATLLTLPERERTEGWAEVVKYGMILDAELFAALEANAENLRTFAGPSAELLCRIIAGCIELKVEVIEQDEREQGQRAILNYGHTIAHALEQIVGYGILLHGEAVSIGMAAAAQLAEQAGMIEQADVDRQNKVLTALSLPVSYSHSLEVRAIFEAIQLDKKVADKQVRWIMPRSIGQVEVTTLPPALVERVITAFFQGAE
jgi:shikimate kinase/3-dehydroquinate synthase